MTSAFENDVHGGLSMPVYAQAMAQRERILDTCGVRKHSTTLTGELAEAWIRLREHAIQFGLPIVEGDLDATNRIAEWDRRVMFDEQTRGRWHRAYPHELARVCSLDPDESIGRASVVYIAQQSAFVWNGFVPLHLRRPGVTEDVLAFARRLMFVKTAPLRPANDARASQPALDMPVSGTGSQRSALASSVHSPSGPPPSSGEREIDRGVLGSSGLDADTYGKIRDRWLERYYKEPALRAELAESLRRHAAATPKEPLPAMDSLVLPGQKLARVSDFARICRAARRGEFNQALKSAGVGRDTYANLCTRFNARLENDKVIEEQFRRLLEDPRVDQTG